jgi:hypothetical protein
VDAGVLEDRAVQAIPRNDEIPKANAGALRLGILGGNAQVTGEYELEPGADRVALDGG